MKLEHVLTPNTKINWKWIKDLNIKARIYNGVETISLTSGAGKTGQPFVKEWN